MSEFDAVRSRLATKDKPQLHHARLAHAVARRRFQKATAAGDKAEQHRAVLAMKQHRAAARRVVEAR